MNIAVVFGFVLVLFAVGALLARHEVVPASAPETLNVIALNVCMPAAILLHAPKLSLTRELFAIALVPWLVLLGAVLVLVPLVRALRFERGTRACILLCAPLGNTAFLGYVLVPALAGPGSLRYAVVYDQLGTFLALATYGLFVLAALGGAEKPTLGGLVRRVVRFPPFIALVLALTVVPGELPPATEGPLGLVAGALLPIVALALGMQLRVRVGRGHVFPLALILGTKLVFLPALALAVCVALGLGGEARGAVVYQTAMPTMMTTAALLSAARLEPELAAAAVAYGTLASMVSLPLWHLAV